MNLRSAAMDLMDRMEKGEFPTPEESKYYNHKGPLIL
jgi:hypothetical protein